MLRKCDVRRKRKSLQLFQQTLTVNSSVIDVDTRRHNFLVKLSESVRNAVFLQRYLNQKTFFAAFSTKLLNLGLLSFMSPSQFSSTILKTNGAKAQSPRLFYVFIYEDLIRCICYIFVNGNPSPSKYGLQ